MTISIHKGNLKNEMLDYATYHPYYRGDNSDIGSYLVEMDKTLSRKYQPVLPWRVGVFVSTRASMDKLFENKERITEVKDWIDTHPSSWQKDFSLAYIFGWQKEEKQYLIKLYDVSGLDNKITYVCYSKMNKTWVLPWARNDRDAMYRGYVVGAKDLENAPDWVKHATITEVDTKEEI